MTWGMYTRRLILCVLVGDVNSARATATAMWGAGDHFTARHGSYFVINAACTESEAATWRTAVNGYTGSRWYLLDAESRAVLETNSSHGVVGEAFKWTDVTEDLARVRRVHYASPDGDGDGSQASPFALEAALNSSVLVPGDVLHLSPGTYVGDFNCTLKGRVGKPIVVEANAAALNGAIHFEATGAYVRVIGLDAAYLDWTKRETDGLTYPPEDLPNFTSVNGGVQLHMPGVEIVNAKVHDYRIGVGSWYSALNAQLYGCMLYHNGWFNPNEVGQLTHGEGIYTENRAGSVKVIEQCVGWNNFDHNLAIFGTNEKTDSYRVKDCIWFNDEIQFGGKQNSTDLWMTGCAVYATQDVVFGFNGFPSADLHLLNNVFAMPPDWFRMLWFFGWQQVEFKHNIVVGNETTYPVVIQNPPANWSDWQWDDNTYYYTPRTPDLPGYPFYVEGVGGLTFEQWQTLTGYDVNSTYIAGKPPNQVKVYLNQHAPRATVAIYNWSKVNTVSVDLSGLPAGNYRAFNLQNLAEYFDFNFAGDGVVFPMTDWTASTPIGYATPIEALTFPEYGAFVLEAL